MTGISLAMGLAAVCGIVAASYWLKVATSVDDIGDTEVRVHRQALSRAATATAATLIVAAATVLVRLLAAV
jgi:hypothetical protein